MRFRSRYAAGALAVSLAAATGGCATNPLPPNRSVSQEAAITSGRGAYALAYLSTGGQVTGELIAIGGGRAVILDDEKDLITLSYGELNELRLGVHDNNKSGFVAWTVLGTLSTLSHGFLLVFSAPSWILLGGSSTAAESYSGIFDCRPLAETKHPESACLKMAARFARFPQGLPPGVGLAQLLGAPVPPPPPVQAPPPGPAPPATAPPTAPAPPADFPTPYEPGI